MDWQEYWHEVPSSYEETDFWKQVRRTVQGGQPTPRAELDLLIGEVVRLLELREDSKLLDLCCGNGLLSVRLGESCSRLVGVDFSEPLVGIARKHHGSPRIDYLRASVLDLAPSLFEPDLRFDRICMIESLQYFRPEELPRLLRGIRSVASPGFRLVMTGILELERRWSFFDTPERRASYEAQRREGKEVMGYWWRREQVQTAAESLGLDCRIVDQDSRLNTAHYRFDAVITEE